MHRLVARGATTFRSWCCLLLIVGHAFAIDEGRRDAPVKEQDRFVSLFLKAVSAGPASNESSPWMFDDDSLPFEEKNQGTGWYAPARLFWSSNETGDGSCPSGGPGSSSIGSIEDSKSNIPGISTPGRFSARMDNFTLDNDVFVHVNTLDESLPWDRLGEAGDRRRYLGGNITIVDELTGTVAFRAFDVVMNQNFSYKGPIGAGLPVGSFVTSATFLGHLDVSLIEASWLAEFDPRGSGVFYGVLAGFVIGNQDCFSSQDVKIRIEIPPVRALEITNVSNSSSPQMTIERQVAVAKSLGQVSVSITAATAIVSASAAIAGGSICALAAAGGTAASFAGGGSGVPLLLRTAARVAMYGHVGNLSRKSLPLQSFTDQMKSFLVRFPAPWNGGKSVVMVRHDVSRQELPAGDGSPITESQFVGTAFWSFLILSVCLLIHGVIAIFMRRSQFSSKLDAHSWMVYLTFIAISYIYAGIVLACLQYIMLPVSARRNGLLVLDAIMLVLFGVGILGFIVFILVSAFRHIRIGRLIWVPKEEVSNAQTRNSRVLQGEYETDDGNIIHHVFACYYDNVHGRAFWCTFLFQTLSALEILVVGLVSNARDGYLALCAVGVVVFIAMIFTNPMVNKVEGVFQVLILLVQVIAWGVGVGATIVSRVEQRNQWEYGAVILESIVLWLTIILAVYLDGVPTLYSLWLFVSSKLRGHPEEEPVQRDPEMELTNISHVLDNPEAEYAKITKDRHTLTGRDTDGSSSV